MTRSIVFATVVLLMGTLVRRLSIRSGATDAEANGVLPGDDVIAHPSVECTRAITAGPGSTQP